MGQDQSNVGRRDATDPFRLIEVDGAYSTELFPSFDAQRTDGGIVEGGGDFPFRHAMLLVDLQLLTADVALVFDVVETLLRGILFNGTQRLDPASHFVPIDFRSTQVHVTRYGFDPGALEDLHCLVDLTHFGREGFAAVLVDQSELVCQWCESSIGVVLTKQQSILGTTGEHPIRFVSAGRDQVVYQHTDVSLITCGDPGRLAGNVSCCVETGNQSLAGRLFVTGRAVDLPGKEETGDRLGFQMRPELGGWTVVVFDSVAISHDDRPFETGDHRQHLILDVAGQAGGDTVDVNLLRLASLWLEKQLVSLFVCKSHHLVFDARAISGTPRVNLAAVHRGAVKVGPDQLVDALVGVRDVTGELFEPQLTGQE